MSEWKLVPVELVKFLLGEGEWMGRAFGDANMTFGGKRVGRYWWRTDLRAALDAASPVPPEPDSCMGLSGHVASGNVRAVPPELSGNPGELPAPPDAVAAPVTEAQVDRLIFDWANEAGIIVTDEETEDLAAKVVALIKREETR